MHFYALHVGKYVSASAPSRLQAYWAATTDVLENLASIGLSEGVVQLFVEKVEFYQCMNVLGSWLRLAG